MEYIIDSVKYGHSKEEIANGLVEKAINNGSPDNVTVIVVNLSDLYSKWQCSTPFHIRSNSDNWIMMSNFSFSSHINGKNLDTWSLFYSKDRAIDRTVAMTEDIDMEEDDQDHCSRIYVTEPHKYDYSNRHSDPQAVNIQRWPIFKTQPYSTRHLDAQYQIQYKQQEKSEPNPFSKPINKSSKDLLKKSQSENSEKVNRMKTQSKRNKDSSSFIF